LPKLTKDPTPRRDWVAKAAKTGDWSQEEKKSRKALGRSGAEIRQSRSRKDARAEKIRTFEGPAWEREPEPSLADDDDQDLLLPDEASPADDEIDALPEDAERQSWRSGKVTGRLRSAMSMRRIERRAAIFSCPTGCSPATAT